MLYKSVINQQDSVSGDIHERIQEIQNWDEEELEDDSARSEQIVSFPPDSRNSSPTARRRRRSVSPTTRRLIGMPTADFHFPTNAPVRPSLAQTTTGVTMVEEGNKNEEFQSMEVDEINCVCNNDFDGSRSGY